MFAENKDRIITKLKADDIDKAIVDIVLGMNQLPFLYTTYCCAGFGEGRSKSNKQEHEATDMPYVKIVYNKNDNRWKEFNANMCEIMPFGSITGDFSRISADYIGLNYSLVLHYRSRHLGYSASSLKDLKRNAWQDIGKIIEKFNPSNKYELNISGAVSEVIEYKLDKYTNEMCWFRGNDKHKIGVPAIDTEYTQAWFVNDKLHREDGPALIMKKAKHNKEEYWQNGKIVVMNKGI